MVKLVMSCKGNEYIVLIQMPLSDIGSNNVKLLKRGRVRGCGLYYN